jgi:predicted Zn-dependent peptidase
MSRISNRTLACGMPLIVEAMPNVRSAAVAWLLPAGSAYDPEDRQGMAAMWAELLLRGAGDLNSRQHADAVDRLGASRSAGNGSFTMQLGTNCLGSRLPDVLPFLVDMVRRPRMEEDAIEPTRDLCIQAIESLKDDPQERAMLAARLRHHPTPINRSGMGEIEHLENMTRDELIAGWKRLANPRPAIFAAAGAVEPDALAAQLDRLLAGWSGLTVEPSFGPVPARGYAHETDQSSQVQIILVHDAPAEPAPESLLEKIVLNVLSGGMAGRLFSEVREKRGLCYSVSAGYRGDREYGSVTAYVGTTPERANDSLEVLLAELRRISTPEGRVTKDEFDRAIVGMKSGLIMSGESTGARAGSLAADQRKLGHPRSLEEIAAKVDAVTLDEVNAYLAKRRMGTLTIQTLGPNELKVPG